MTDPLDSLPADLQGEIRRIWDMVVAGGRARFQADGDRSGATGQRTISALLKAAGIGESDPRWRVVIDHGRALYYGQSGAEADPGLRADTDDADADDDGTPYKTGEDFRARAEARQRRFRVDVLRAGCRHYGHLLDDEATAAGANFVHPAALQAIEDRAAAGKGVDRPRTFGNMLSSQAMCFNLLGPLLGDLGLAAEVLAPSVPSLVAVDSIQLEYTPAFEVFRDQRGDVGVDADALIEFRSSDGTKGVLVIETKFIEPSFSSCGHRKDSARHGCPTEVSLGDGFEGCAYTSKNKFLYWHRSAETNALRVPVVRATGCPFGGDLWQLWVNHTLAHVEARSRGAARALFAVCAPRENDVLAAEARLSEFRRYLTDPSTALFIPVEDVVSRIAAVATQRGTDWTDWAARLRGRYVVSAGEQAPARTSRPSSPVTDSHRRVVNWMATPAFASLVASHRGACRGRASIYFRPTDKGLVRIALHPSAPGYVGFRRDAADEGHVLRVPGALPTEDDIAERLDAFEAWLPSVRRRSNEEMGVIPWLARALESALVLPELGDGWVFLHQEWRFTDDAGTPMKSDVLAVHVPSGRLGIVEFKSSVDQLAAARAQVEEYGRYWLRDALELAPFFTTLIRAMGTAYGNGAAATVTVTAEPAELFVGVASAREGVLIEKK